MSISIRSTTYTKLIKPRSSHPDDQRREYIFTVLIVIICAAAALSLVSSSINHLLGNAPKGANSIPITAAFLLICLCSWWRARKGHYKVGAFLVVFLVWLASLQLTLAWSFELPMAQLVAVLAIAIAGVLLSSRAAVVVTLVTATTTLILGYLQVHSLVAANSSWMTGSLEYSDAIGQAVVFAIIGGVLWLSNKEIDSLLRRAWRSEAALAKERDELEITVAKRTQELERIQLERVLELQNLAEFGRVSASLLHDLANPVTSAALTVEQAGEQRNPELLDQAMVSIAHIERYIATARKQLQGREEKQSFQAGQEISEVVELLQHQAQLAKVGMSITIAVDSTVRGHVVAYHRVMANLIMNAIQSYDGKQHNKHNQVLITVGQSNNHAVITVQDHGVGIATADLPHIFDDYFSTKKSVGRGLGLGLSNAKRVIEADFGGSIIAQSALKSGTLFTIEIPLHEATHTTKHSGRRNISGKSAAAKR